MDISIWVLCVATCMFAIVMWENKNLKGLRVNDVLDLHKLKADVGRMEEELQNLFLSHQHFKTRIDYVEKNQK